MCPVFYQSVLKSVPYLVCLGTADGIPIRLSLKLSMKTFFVIKLCAFVPACGTPPALPYFEKKKKTVSSGDFLFLNWWQ